MLETGYSMLDAGCSMLPARHIGVKEWMFDAAITM